MAPLPENNTGRIFLDYTSMGIQHTMLLRLPLVLPASPIDYANTYAAIIATRMLTSDSVLAARYSSVGTDFSLPLNFTPTPGVVNPTVNVWIEDPEAAFISLIARGNASGREARYLLFTPVRTVDWPLDNRYSPGESAPIDTLRTNFINHAQVGGIAPLVSIFGDGLSFKNYVNIAKNAYWQRRQRV